MGALKISCSVAMANRCDACDAVTPTYYVIFTGFTLITTVVSALILYCWYSFTRGPGPVQRSQFKCSPNPYSCNGVPSHLYVVQFDSYS